MDDVVGGFRSGLGEYFEDDNCVGVRNTQFVAALADAASAANAAARSVRSVTDAARIRPPLSPRRSLSPPFVWMMRWSTWRLLDAAVAGPGLGAWRRCHSLRARLTGHSRAPYTRSIHIEGAAGSRRTELCAGGRLVPDMDGTYFRPRAEIFSIYFKRLHRRFERHEP